MNLTTHTVVGFALGIAVFQNVQIALVMSIGALIPDLDREYLFIAKDKIGEYQLHRALFHNFFFIALLSLLNPFLGFGALTHVLLDMSTTATDRGAEVLFPITRVRKGFLHSIDGDAPNAEKKTKWWVEDPWGLLQKTSDRDLGEPEHQAWRRMYGPFKNSRVADWGIFFTAITFSLIVWGMSNGSAYSLSGFANGVFISAGGIGTFYTLGEWWRKRPIEKQNAGRVRWYVLAILLAGLAVFAYGMEFLFLPVPLSNYAYSTMLYALVSSVIGLAAGYALVKVRQKEQEITI